MPQTHVTTVECEWHQAGQPRPYADSIYEATLRFSTTAPWASKWDPPEVTVEAIAQAVMNRGKFVRKDDPERQWHQTYAERFDKVSDSTWRIKLIQPYCD